MRILGLDPGLRITGWGIIQCDGNRLRPVSHGTVSPPPTLSMAERLSFLHEGLTKVIHDYDPDEAAVEETFVNKNPVSTLKLGQARGVVLLVPAQANLPVAEYAPNQIKKAVVGSGHASKEQISQMIKHILPLDEKVRYDAADAFAVAICHYHMRETRAKWGT
ncbi:MAG: crossover junction endodeoxyribonuclease RuvC [Alphaproteobacteria bacterium]|jgi:crossover junction endodeoxyribonuclease RuvC|nr:crossover junction endodeoxyribonuclease RuvC [Alphaproteobacteria bacterium]MBT5389223.1 crossover junction endodeoxyribonuclease RuvC [Alphaproteobacteria bacterium]MBT5540687.1 crossover junction endodeoxyribonuclease RuvC [Alphaproteobacteria bacterium]MBT5654294.1 crossover junction endodeoxyribonuclease RuvC [Alphaproteobacteria bacterium]